MAETGEKIGDLYVNIGAQTADLKKGVEESKEIMVAAGEQMVAIGQAMTITITTTIAGLFGAGFRAAVSETEEGQNAMIELGKAISDVKKEYGEMFNEVFNVSGAVEALARTVQRFADWLDSLSTNQKRFIISLGGVLAAIGPLMIAFGNLKMAGLGIKSAFVLIGAAVGPVIPLVLAIAAAVAAIGTLFFVATGEGDTWKERFTSGMNETKASIGGWLTVAKEKFDLFAKWAKFAWGTFALVTAHNLDAALFAIVAWANNVVIQFEWFRDNWKQILEWFKTASVQHFKNIGNAITQIFKNLWHNIKEGGRAAWDFLFGSGEKKAANFKKIMDGVGDDFVALPVLTLPPPNTTDIKKALDEKRVELVGKVTALYEEIFRKTGDAGQAAAAAKKLADESFVEGEEEKQKAIRKTRDEMTGFFGFAEAVNKVQAVISGDFATKQEQAAAAALVGPNGKMETEDTTVAKKMDKLIVAVKERPAGFPAFGEGRAV